MAYQKDLSGKTHGISGQKRTKNSPSVFGPGDYYEPPPKTKKTDQDTEKLSSVTLRILLLLFVLLFMCLFLALDTQAQSKSKKETDFDLLVQELFATPDDDLDYTDLYESLFQFFTQPINLNNTNREELQSIFFLSDTQISNLLSHIAQNGKLLSIKEIQAVPGFDLPTIYKLLPFVMVYEANLTQDAESVFKRMWKGNNSNVIVRYERTLEQKQGFAISERDTNSRGEPRSRYLGDPNKVYIRYRNSHTNDYSIGFTLEKDQGEPLSFGQHRGINGFDFLSFHGVVHNQKRFKTIAVGDYIMQIGQGLLLAGGFGVGKGAETISTIRRSTLGIRPYTSVLEGGFFRGAAVTYKLTKRIDITPFYSRLRQDANVRENLDTLSEESEEQNEYISSIQATGFHRTRSEIAAKNRISEQAGGLVLNYKSENGNFEGGVVLMGNFYSKNLIRTLNTYNQYEFQGRRNLLLGVNYSYYWRNFNFFGETGRSSSGGIGTVNGLIAALSTSVDVSVLYRSYDRDFHSFYGGALSENTRNINERGLYMGIKIKPNKRWLITSYLDQFYFPWLKFLTDAPSGGYEHLTRITYKPSKTITLYVNYRQEVRERNWRSPELNMNISQPYRRQNLQINCDYKAEKVISLRSRVQLSSFQHHQTAQTKGFAIVQDITFDLRLVKLSTRFALFDTEDYENRQYVYEKDVLYLFYVPAYYGRGFRNYYLAQFNIGKRCDLWVKYAYTKYRNQDIISSGLEAIRGDTKSDVRVQLLYKF
ncbi:MAG: hypothetical protein EAZ57_06005 [Cytophagales bacterium]|nr:MAG: hypothetical protein EAZ67_08195 [Cytophagales bacterium]TAF60736.1 MAG: hypothetical protein EAZ57_06005 [Cytophagales bacterium]